MYLHREPGDENWTTHGRAPFLILMECHECQGEVRALVRQVSMHWVAPNWFRGLAKIKKQYVRLNGCFGNRGSTLKVPREIFDLGVQLPPTLQEQFRLLPNDDLQTQLTTWALDNIHRLEPAK